MAVKKVVSIVFLILLIAAVIWIAYENFHTPKQIYEGILVYAEELENSEQNIIYYQI